MKRFFHVPRHKQDLPVVRSAAPLGFKPRHCDGVSCLHDHTGASRRLVGTMRVFPKLMEPVTQDEIDDRLAGRDKRLPLPTWKKRAS